MKTYGLTNYGQRGCCPGHDDFPGEAYGSKTSKKKYRSHTKVMRRRKLFFNINL